MGAQAQQELFRKNQPTFNQSTPSLSANSIDSQSSKDSRLWQRRYMKLEGRYLQFYRAQNRKELLQEVDL